MPLLLPDVTLCAVTCINHELTARAMEECLRHCSFADVVLFSSKPVAAPFRVEVIEPFGGEYYGTFVCRNLAKITPSNFNLIVQYDSYVIDPEAWTDEFFKYDYIGAKWPWHPPGKRVGNSGFCLRSKKLLNILTEIELPPLGTWVDDELICHRYREELETKYGIKIAPEEIADQFAYERHVPIRPSFGFHGLFNFWRHTSDAEMIKIPAQLSDYNVHSISYIEVMLRYYAGKKIDVFAAWYGHMRQLFNQQRTKEHLLHWTINVPLIDGVMQAGESLINQQERVRNSA